MALLAATREFMDVLFVDDRKDEFCFDLSTFIKEELFGVTLLCDFESIDEYRAELDSNPLWEILLDKCDDVKFRPQLDLDIQQDDFYKGISEENIFLTSLTFEECEKLSLQRGYIYISVSDIAKTWSPIKFIRANGFYKVTNDRGFPEDMKFDSWEKLDFFTIPLTSMIIFDKYILGDKSNQRIKDNLLKLLKKLCTNSLSKPLNLTIISEFDTDAEIIRSYERIENYFLENNVRNVKLNIIRHDKNKYPPEFEGLHYRVILTNNIRIRCDDSFNFFKSNGKVNNDADIYLAFRMSRRSRCFYEKEIHQIKRYVSRLQNHGEEIQLKDKVYYHVDKCNYLFN